MKSQVSNRLIGRRVAAVVAAGLVTAGSVAVGVPVAEAQDDVAGFREVETSLCEVFPDYDQVTSAKVPPAGELYKFVYPTQEEVDSFVEVDWEDVEKYKYLVAAYQPDKRPVLHFAESSGEYYYQSTWFRPNPDGSKDPLYFRRIVESDYIPEEFLDLPDSPPDQLAIWDLPGFIKPGLIPAFSKWAPLEERLQYFLSHPEVFEFRPRAPKEMCVPLVHLKRPMIWGLNFYGNREPGDGAFDPLDDLMFGENDSGVTWAKVDESSELLYGSSWSVKNLDTGVTYHVTDSDEPIKEPDWDSIDWERGKTPEQQKEIDEYYRLLESPEIDQDPDPGVVSVQLEAGSYELTEATAPLGYILSKQPIRFDVADEYSTIPLGEVINRKVPPTTVTITTTTTTRETETETTTVTETPSTATTTVTEPTTVTTTPPTVTTTLPPSTVVTTATPPPATVTETPKTETTTATSEVTTTVTSTPPTETTTLPPETETVTTTETPEPKTSTETTTATTEKTTTETTTATEKVPTTVVTTETPERETVTEHVPTTFVTTQPGTTNVMTTTSTVTAPPATVTETKECDCTPTTVTAPSKTVTETPAPVTSTVTKEVPITMVKDRTEIVKLPPETVTKTPDTATETVTTTVEKPGPAPQPTPQRGQVTTVVETPPAAEVPPVIPGAFSGTVVWDEDRSKTVNNGDERIPGLTVVAYKDGKEIARTTTDENGFYKFDNLEPGEYGIAVYGPDGGELFFEDKTATVVAGEEDTGNDWGFVREDAPAPVEEGKPATPVETVRQTLATTGANSYALAGLSAVLAALVALAVVSRRKVAHQ